MPTCFKGSLKQTSTLFVHSITPVINVERPQNWKVTPQFLLAVRSLCRAGQNLSSTGYFPMRFGVDLLRNSGIEVVSIIYAYIDTFVLVISTITECPLLDSNFPNQDRSSDGGRDYMKTLQGTWTQIIRPEVTFLVV